MGCGSSSSSSSSSSTTTTTTTTAAATTTQLTLPPNAHYVLAAILNEQSPAAIALACTQTVGEIQRDGATFVRAGQLEDVSKARLGRHGGHTAWTPDVQAAYDQLVRAASAAPFNEQPQTSASDGWSSGRQAAARVLHGGRLCRVPLEHCTRVLDTQTLELCGEGGVWLPFMEYDVRQPGAEYSFQVRACPLAHMSEIIIAVSANQQLWMRGYSDAVSFRTGPEGGTWLRSGMFEAFLGTTHDDAPQGRWITLRFKLTHTRYIAYREFGSTYFNVPWPSNAALKGVVGLINYRNEPVQYRPVQHLVEHAAATPAPTTSAASAVHAAFAQAYATPSAVAAAQNPVLVAPAPYIAPPTVQVAPPTSYTYSVAAAALPGQPQAFVADFGAKAMTKVDPVASELPPAGSQSRWDVHGSHLLHDGQPVHIAGKLVTAITPGDALEISDIGAVWLPQFMYDVRQPGSTFKFSVTLRPTANDADAVIAFSCNQVMWEDPSGVPDAVTFRVGPEGNACVRSGMFKDVLASSRNRVPPGTWKTLTIFASHEGLQVEMEGIETPILTSGWPAGAALCGCIGLVSNGPVAVQYRDLTLGDRVAASTSMSLPASMSAPTAAPSAASAPVSLPTPAVVAATTFAQDVYGNVTYAGQACVALAPPDALSVTPKQDLLFKGQGVVFFPHLSYVSTSPCTFKIDLALMDPTAEVEFGISNTRTVAGGAFDLLMCRLSSDGLITLRSPSRGMLLQESSIRLKFQGVNSFLVQLLPTAQGTMLQMSLANGSSFLCSPLPWPTPVSGIFCVGNQQPTNVIVRAVGFVSQYAELSSKPAQTLEQHLASYHSW